MPITFEILSLVVGILGGVFGAYIAIKNYSQKSKAEAVKDAVRLTSIENNMINLIGKVDDLKNGLTEQHATDTKVKSDIAALTLSIEKTNMNMNTLKEEFQRYKDGGQTFNVSIGELRNDMISLNRRVDAMFDIVDKLTMDRLSNFARSGANDQKGV